jgi:RNA polymerase sigma-70 factor (ECF subfamily)
VADELLNEPELLRRAQAGDRNALEVLLRAQYQRVFAVCFRMMGSRPAAEDQTQEALLRISRGISTFQGNAAFSTWCHRVASTTCIDELRKQRRRPLTTSLTRDDGAPIEMTDGADITTAIEWTDVRADIRDALNTLPVEFARAVVMRDVLELDYVEIAELSGVAVGTIKSRISRGRAMLSDVLGGNHNATGDRLTDGDTQ